MKILLLTPQLPYPPHQGTSLRNYHIVRGLAARHELHLLSFQEEQSPDVENPLFELCASVTIVPVPGRTGRQRVVRLLSRRQPDMAHRLESGAFDGALEQLLRQETFDVVQVEGIELARVMPTVRRLSRRSLLIFDDHNAEAALQQRAFLTDLRAADRLHAAAYSFIQARRLARFEAWACRMADGVTVVSEADRHAICSLLAAQWPARPYRATAGGSRHELPIQVVPNCIDVSEYARTPDGPPPRYDLVFSGKMDYRPNVDAVLWFGREIWPLILRARPGTTWAIVGQQPHPRLDELRQARGVTLTGRVPDVLPYLHGASVYVMPLRMGSGTRLKLIEAMAAEKAIVSTQLGVEGFAVTDGQEVMLADTGQAFAAAVVQLLKDEGRRQRLGRTARRFAVQYDWRNIIPRFDEFYARIQPADQNY